MADLAIYYSIYNIVDKTWIKRELLVLADLADLAYLAIYYSIYNIVDKTWIKRELLVVDKMADLAWTWLSLFLTNDN